MRHHGAIFLSWLTAGLVLVPAGAGAWQADPGLTEEEAAARKAEEKITDRPEAEVIAEIEAVMNRITGKAKSDFPALDKDRKQRAVRDLGALPHPRTLAALQKIFAGRHEPHIRGAAAEALGHMKFERKKAAKVLTGRIKKEWDHKDVLIGIARGLGELRLVLDREEMYRFFKHPDDEVYVSMIECLGAMKDVASLPKLEEIFGQYGKLSSAGVNVRVDTGAAGTKDQQAASARGRGMMQKARADRRKNAVHAVKRALKHITGEEFEFSDKFSVWLRENEERLGLTGRKKKRR